MGALRHFVALVLSTSLCGGCAAGAGGSWSARLVQPGKPATDLGGPAPSAHGRSEPAAHALRSPVNAGLSVENFDERLSAALLAETLLPSAENHLRVAEEYRRLDILDASAQHIDQALILEPRFADAHEALARIWRDWGFPDRGLAPAYRAVFYAPQSASAENTLATILASLGRTDDARRAYERALTRDARAAWVLSNLCDLERQVGRLQVAEERCHAALALDPNLAVAHNNLALTFAARGDLIGARAEFMAGGDEAAANYNMGLVHMAGGQYASAADAFEAAIRSRPTFTAAKRRAHTLRLYLLTGGK